MATTRTPPFKVTAAIWNAVLSCLNDAGNIYIGAVAGTTIQGASGTFTTDVTVSAAPNNQGVTITATSTNSPAVTFGNASTGVVGRVAGGNDGSVTVLSNGAVTTAAKFHAGGGLSIGGTTAPATGSLHVIGGEVLIGNQGTPAVRLTSGGSPGTAAGPHSLALLGSANGTGAATGNYVNIGHNSSGNGAAGALRVYTKAGVEKDLWPDSTGVWRTASAQAPSESGGDTSGTIVGPLPSSLDSKDILGDGMAPDAALALVAATPVKRFTYKDGRYAAGEFHGIVADWSPAFAMDADETHPNGRSFNQVSACGILIQAVKALETRLAAVEAR